MSRLTGNEAKDLMEAYASIYAPQQLTEEQVWEEVEYWVNSLLEEGYDLSDYTWEEMYDLYEDEYGRGGFNLGTQVRGALGGLASNIRGTAGAIRRGFTGTQTSRTDPISRAGNAYTRTITAPARAGVRFVQGLSGAPSPYGQGNRPAPTRQPQPQKAPGKGGPPIRPVPGNERAPAPRQQAPAPRQQAPAGTAGTTPPAKSTSGTAGTTPPAKSTPGTAGTTPPAKSTPGTAGTTGTTPPSGSPNTNPTATPPAPKPEGERALSKLPGGNYSAAATSMMSQRTKNILGTTKTPAAKPMGSARERMLNQSFDPFDVVIGHLIDEGYADTEEAALAIMANMSEEWRQSIVEDGKWNLGDKRPGVRVGGEGTRRYDSQTNTYKPDASPATHLNLNPFSREPAVQTTVDTGRGFRVTVGKDYPSYLNGKRGNTRYDEKGRQTFRPAN